MENTAIRRSVTPRVSPADDPSKAKHSRWQLQLPQTNLPLDRFTCASPTALFQRDLRLYESVADERGRSGQITLGQASWTRTPVSRAPELSLTLSRSPAGDTLYLETFNGDNPPIGLERFQFFYPVTRVYFKVTDTNDVLAYYGQAKAESPRYDLTLVADQLLKVEVNSASLGTEEPLQGTGWRGRWAGGGTMRLVFWGALILAVVGMLVVITRLLPAQPPR